MSIKIGFVGLPSTGKTTLARAVAGRLSLENKLGTVDLVSEYARRYLSKYSSIGLCDQFKIFCKQKEWEDSLLSDIVITDSPIFAGFSYSILQLPFTNKDVMYVNDLFKAMRKANFPRRYDIIFHVPDNLPEELLQQDGVRLQEHFNHGWRHKMDGNLVNTFLNIFPPVLEQFNSIKSKDFDKRVEECVSYIYKKIPQKIL